MRLKRLHLQGFKTFAPKTELQFGEGLTAIVGPNGSGKSNIADAIRWALGEQSFTNLRAKKTEDLIFAGSSKRAPLGMAEVSITIDNSDHLLPLNFAEVTLTRRAYRSGDNEYYINKSRVRLRDVLDIASTLGQAYTVVGQGLVDAALSLRPEERRELFEEAAAIRGYFVQREDALKRLTRTEENVTRLSDLAAELEPQVRRMERQARQAQEYGKLETEFHELLEKWYAGRWLRAVTELRKAEQAEAACAGTVEARRAEVATISAQLAEARANVWQLVDAVSEMHEQRAQIQARHAAQSQAQAVLAERLSATVQQRQSLTREHAGVLAGLEKARSQAESLKSEADQRQAEIAALETEGRDVSLKLTASDAKINELHEQHRQESAQAEGLARRLADLDSRLREGQRQRAEQESAATEGETALSALRHKLEAEESALDERKGAVSMAQRAIAGAEHDLTQAQTALRATRTERSSAEEKRRELGRQADSLASQLATLTGEQQSNLYGGVRAIVAAAREGKLEGYVGTVAELLKVPAQYEVAIEAALGGRLQEVVVSKWADAERAIAMLKQSGAGRATFLPLDTLRASRPPTAPPTGSGVVGLANELVEHEPALSALANSLLGRLLIMEDLASARRVVTDIAHNAPWTLATLGGEVVRPGGSVTGGSNTRADDSRAKGRTVLGRERKRRELQHAHEKTVEEIRNADSVLETASAGVRDQENAVSRLTGQLEQARKRHVAAQMAHLEQQGAHSRLQQEIAWRVGLLAETRKTLHTLVSLESDVSAQRVEMEAQLAPVRGRVAALASQIEAFRTERADVARLAGTGETRLAVMSEGLRNLRSKQEESRRETLLLEKRLTEMQERLRLTAQEEENLAGQRGRYAVEVATLAGQLEEIEQRVGPSEREVRVREGEVSQIESEQSRLQEALLESETQHSHAAVEKQRCLGVRESLRIEITEELGNGQNEDAKLVAVTSESRRLEGGTESEPAWLRWEVAWSSSLDAAPDPRSPSPDPRTTNGHIGTEQPNPAELERRVYALKAKLSRLGPVNPLAMEEHEALAERHNYLQTQLADLTSAAEALRKVIGELDRTMRDQFAVTFAQVNEAFQHYFKTLFGGGTARLELTNPQDVGASGIEMMAQPPGKRMQPLAALSGGERALTSAALLFALLKVRPVPFCVLDEVDAALDETNVTRFRASLQELEEKTQFVVITHNRGTIEAADVLYGVSMGGDGTSQLLSLRVEG